MINQDSDLKIILVTQSEEMYQAWVEEFSNNIKNYANLAIIGSTSILEIPYPVDALVSPANSFGFMDGGLDAQYTRHFGKHLQENLQTVIKEQYDGQLLVGQAITIPTSEEKYSFFRFAHEKIRRGARYSKKSDAALFMICAPTMIIPQDIANTINVYLATRAVIRAWKTGSIWGDYAKLRWNPPIYRLNQYVNSIAIPAMGTGLGHMKPEICAKQMRQALEDELWMPEKLKFPEHLRDAQAKFNSMVDLDQYR